MARPGVSKQEVFAAATQLVGEGKGATIAEVRQILQTGSNSTIANYLRQWKREQEGTQLLALDSNLPQEAIALMKGLWERLRQLAEEKCSLLETAHQERVNELNLALEKYKANNQRWQKLFDKWIEEKTLLQGEKSRLEEMLTLLESDKLKLQAVHEVQSKELLEKNERITELQRLHQQVQANLEHYREAVREQRLLDLQQFDKQKQELQGEAMALKDQLSHLRDKTSALQQEHQTLLQQHNSLEKTQTQTTVLLEKLKVELSEVEKAKLREAEANLHWQAQFKELQKSLELKSTQYIDSQTDVKTLARRLEDTQKTLDELIAQNKLLQNDKWVLIQEKAQLEGQAKQMQAMIEK